MLFFKTPFVRITCLLFALVFLANIFHLVGSGVFVVAILLFLVLIGGYFVIWRLSPANAVARDQAQSAQSAALAAPLPAGAGAVYLSRYGSPLLPGPAIEAAIQPAAPAELRASTTILWVLPAGRHTLQAAIKGTNAVSQNLPASTTFDLAAGQTLFLLGGTTMDLKRYTVHLNQDPDPATAPTRIAGTTLLTPTIS